MCEMQATAEYLLKLVLELVDKCKSLEELRKAVENVLKLTSPNVPFPGADVTFTLLNFRGGGGIIDP